MPRYSTRQAFIKEIETQLRQQTCRANIMRTDDSDSESSTNADATFHNLRVQFLQTAYNRARCTRYLVPRNFYRVQNACHIFL